MSTVTSPDVERIDAQLVEIDEYENRWSTASRKIRRTALEQLREAAVERARADRSALQMELAERDASLSALYDELISKLVEVNNAAEAVRDNRASYDTAFRQARAAGLELPAWVPRLAGRSQTQRDVLAEIYRLRAWAGSDI